MSDEAREAIARNLAKAMTDDGPPRIRRDTELVVLGRSTCGGYVLIGGLGPFGVGRMWFKRLGSEINYPGHDESPVVDYTPTTGG